jgi:hypothetical protein
MTREIVRAGKPQPPLHAEHPLPSPKTGEIVLLVIGLVIAIGFAGYGIVQNLWGG